MKMINKIQFWDFSLIQAGTLNNTCLRQKNEERNG